MSVMLPTFDAKHSRGRFQVARFLSERSKTSDFVGRGSNPFRTKATVLRTSQDVLKSGGLPALVFPQSNARGGRGFQDVFPQARMSAPGMGLVGRRPGEISYGSPEPDADNIAGNRVSFKLPSPRRTNSKAEATKVDTINSYERITSNFIGAEKLALKLIELYGSLRRAFQSINNNMSGKMSHSQFSIALTIARIDAQELCGVNVLKLFGIIDRADGTIDGDIQLSTWELFFEKYLSSPTQQGLLTEDRGPPARFISKAAKQKLSLARLQRSPIETKIPTVRTEAPGQNNESKNLDADSAFGSNEDESNSPSTGPVLSTKQRRKVDSQAEAYAFQSHEIAKRNSAKDDPRSQLDALDVASEEDVSQTQGRSNNTAVDAMARLQKDSDGQVDDDVVQAEPQNLNPFTRRESIRNVFRETLKKPMRAADLFQGIQDAVSWAEQNAKAASAATQLVVEATRVVNVAMAQKHCQEAADHAKAVQEELATAKVALEIHETLDEGSFDATAAAAFVAAAEEYASAAATEATKAQAQAAAAVMERTYRTSASRKNYLVSMRLQKGFEDSDAANAAAEAAARIKEAKNASEALAATKELNTTTTESAFRSRSPPTNRVVDRISPERNDRTEGQSRRTSTSREPKGSSRRNSINRDATNKGQSRRTSTSREPKGSSRRNSINRDATNKGEDLKQQTKEEAGSGEVAKPITQMTPARIAEERRKSMLNAREAAAALRRESLEAKALASSMDVEADPPDPLAKYAEPSLGKFANGLRTDFAEIPDGEEYLLPCTLPYVKAEVVLKVAQDLGLVADAINDPDSAHRRTMVGRYDSLLADVTERLTKLEKGSFARFGVTTLLQQKVLADIAAEMGFCTKGDEDQVYIYYPEDAHLFGGSTETSLMAKVFERYATGFSKGRSVFLRFPDLKTFAEDLQDVMPRAHRTFRKFIRVLESLFDDTLALQCVMGCGPRRITAGLTLEWFQVFVQKALQRVGPDLMEMFFALMEQ